jgi:hypothetical protein
VPAERRTDQDIRGEIATEREQLVEALADLRQSIDDKRRPAAVVGGALAAAVTAGVLVKIAQRFR